MKDQFIEKKFSQASLDMIAKVEVIITDYQRQGYRLSLRQAYYQCVSKNYIPNSEKSYKSLGNLIADARMAGLLDWDAIEDRGRDVITPAHWDSPADIVDAAANSYRIDKWQDQSNHLMVVVEKDALSGVLEPVCRELDIPFTANRGYSSASALYEIAGTLADHCANGKECHILYFGDHDSSGIDMTRDVRDRLQLFSRECIDVVRVALNMDQVQLYNPPNNPAKLEDSRAASYIRLYGYDSWELDALSPSVLADLVRDHVKSFRDEDLWEEALEEEKAQRDALKTMAHEYRRNNP